MIATTTTTTTTRSTRIHATTLLPLLAATCSSFALLPPPTRSRRVIGNPRVFFSSKFSSPHLLPTTPSTWIGAKRLSVMSLSATEKDENSDTKEQENTSPLLAASNDEAANSLASKEKAPPKKLHSVTVCMVPPPENGHIWEQISEMRRTLQDPGYYRWPPHANLLYPFLELGNNVKKYPESSRQSNLEEIVAKLQMAMRQCPPFRIQLRQFGTFGGKQRGVLWLDPESFPLKNDTNESSAEIAPLIQLHSVLEEAFPSCQAQGQKSTNGFTPHMTLSHFENLEAAKAAQDLLSIPNNLEFVLDRIYLLERLGDDGQFLRVAEIGLGESFSALSPREAMFDPPAPFPGMPTSEEDWVHEERMKLKSRRNGKGRGGGGRRGKKPRRRRPWNPRVPDTPEVIAAKRAERKAKRERLEREQQQEQEEAGGGEALLE